MLYTRDYPKNYYREQQQEYDLLRIALHNAPAFQEHLNVTNEAGGIPHVPMSEFIKTPDVSAAVRPKSLSAAVQDGETVLGRINSLIPQALGTDVLDAFVQTLKAQAKGLDSVATSISSSWEEEILGVAGSGGTGSGSR